MSAYSDSNSSIQVFCYLKEKKKVAFRFADIAFSIKVIRLIKTHITTKEPCMECDVISKDYKIFLIFSTTSRHWSIESPIIIVLKQNDKKSPKRGRQGKVKRRETTLKCSFKWFQTLTMWKKLHITHRIIGFL